MAEHPDEARATARAGWTTDAATLTSFARAVLERAGADGDEARVVANVLVWADRVGRPTQGVWRLPILVQRLERGVIRSPCDPAIHPVSEAAVLVDGHNGPGHFVADRAMRSAIELASRSAVGVAGVRNSNYLGPTGFYAHLAAEAGMIGVAMSNSFPKVAAYAGSEAVLGTNPLAFAAPQANGDAVLVDMATSASSGSAIRWATADSEGAEATESRTAAGSDSLAADVIGPFGGAKGFGLGLMVEMLAGALTGAGLSDEVRSMYQDFENGGNNGHLFLAFDISRWIPLSVFHERTEALLQRVRDSGGDQTVTTVRIPGQARWDARRRSDAEGIAIEGHVVAELERVARYLGVPIPWV